MHAPHANPVDTALEEMIRVQIVERGIDNAPLLTAMRCVPRQAFFPPGTLDNVYADRPYPIGHGQTISQPYMVALMTDRLGVLPHHRVLEIGTGSGYQTAVLSHLAAAVYTIERVKPLLDEAFERLHTLNCRNVHFRHGDGTLGWPGEPPFDRLLIAAGAPRVPESLLLSSLVEGGIAVIPIGPTDRQMLTRVVRVGSELKSEPICPCRFVKLIGSLGFASGSAGD